ncbi:MAG: hypothetical protein HQ594_02310, partial [Candidatus Omnitrophica bacterium]|nr:hypothetical protein [Candidatus Omnitrophota bacterium]
MTKGFPPDRRKNPIPDTLTISIAPSGREVPFIVDLEREVTLATSWNAMRDQRMFSFGLFLSLYGHAFARKYTDREATLQAARMFVTQSGASKEDLRVIMQWLMSSSDTRDINMGLLLAHEYFGKEIAKKKNPAYIKMLDKVMGPLFFWLEGKLLPSVQYAEGEDNPITEDVDYTAKRLGINYPRHYWGRVKTMKEGAYAWFLRFSFNFGISPWNKFFPKQAWFFVHKSLMAIYDPIVKITIVDLLAADTPKEVGRALVHEWQHWLYDVGIITKDCARAVDLFYELEKDVKNHLKDSSLMKQKILDMMIDSDEYFRKFPINQEDYAGNVDIARKAFEIVVNMYEDTHNEEKSWEAGWKYLSGQLNVASDYRIPEVKPVVSHPVVAPALFVDTSGEEPVVRELHEGPGQEHEVLNEALPAIIGDFEDPNEGVEKLDEDKVEALCGQTRIDPKRGPPISVYVIKDSLLPEHFRDGLITHTGTFKGKAYNLFIPRSIYETLVNSTTPADLALWRQHEIGHLLDRDADITPTAVEAEAARRIWEARKNLREEADRLLSMLSEEERAFINSRGRQVMLAVSYRELKVRKREKTLASWAFRMVDLKEAVEQLLAENREEGITMFSVSDVARKMVGFAHYANDLNRYTVLSKWMKTAGLNYQDYPISLGMRAASSTNIKNFYFAGFEFPTPEPISGKYRAITDGPSKTAKKIRLFSINEPECALIMEDQAENIKFSFTDSSTEEAIESTVKKPKLKSTFSIDTIPAFIHFMDSILGIPAEFSPIDEDSPREKAIRDQLIETGKKLGKESIGKGNKNIIRMGNTLLCLPGYYEEENFNILDIYSDQQHDRKRLCIVERANPDNFIAFELRRIEDEDIIISSHTGERLPLRKISGKNAKYRCNLSEFELFKRFNQRVLKWGADHELYPTTETKRASYIRFLGDFSFAFWHSQLLSYREFGKGLREKPTTRAHWTSDDRIRYPVVIKTEDEKEVVIRSCPDNKNQCTVDGLTWRETGKPVLFASRPVKRGDKSATTFHLSAIAEAIRNPESPLYGKISADPVFLDIFEFGLTQTWTGAPVRINTLQVDLTRGTIMPLRMKVATDEFISQGVKIVGSQNAADSPKTPSAPARDGSPGEGEAEVFERLNVAPSFKLRTTKEALAYPVPQLANFEITHLYEGAASDIRKLGFSDLNKTIHLMLVDHEGERVMLNLSDPMAKDVLNDEALYDELKRIQNIELFSLHLGFAVEYFENSPDGPKTSAALPDTEVHRRIVNNVHLFKDKLKGHGFGDREVLLENIAYFPGCDYICRPDIIRDVANETECGLLLDLGHAVVTAQSLGMDRAAYVSEMLNGDTIKKLREIHISIPFYMEKEKLWVHGGWRGTPYGSLYEDTPGTRAVKELLYYVFDMRKKANITSPLIINLETDDEFAARDAKKLEGLLLEWEQSREIDNLSASPAPGREARRGSAGEGETAAAKRVLEAARSDGSVPMDPVPLASLGYRASEGTKGPRTTRFARVRGKREDEGRLEDRAEDEKAFLATVQKHYNILLAKLQMERL